MSSLRDASVARRKEVKTVNVNMSIICILMLLETVGLDEIRERRAVREREGAEVKPPSDSVWRTGRAGAACKGH